MEPGISPEGVGLEVELVEDEFPCLLLENALLVGGRGSELVVDFLSKLE